jgi:hypothetical protein
MSSLEGSFPEDPTVHMHGGLIADATPSFLHVQEGEGEAHGIMVLHWSSQACFTAMASTMETLRRILTKWELKPLDHTVLNTYSQGGGLPALISHGLAFQSGEAVHRLSGPQLDIIYRELHVSRRYPGTVKAVAIFDDAKRRVNHRITVTRVVDREGPTIMVDSFSEASKRFHHKENLTFSFTPGVTDDGNPAPYEQDVYRLAVSALAGINGHLTKMDFVPFRPSL